MRWLLPLCLMGIDTRLVSCRKLTNIVIPFLCFQRDTKTTAERTFISTIFRRAKDANGVSSFQSEPPELLPRALHLDIMFVGEIFGQSRERSFVDLVKGWRDGRNIKGQRSSKESLRVALSTAVSRWESTSALHGIDSEKYRWIIFVSCHFRDECVSYSLLSLIFSSRGGR